MHKLEQIKNKIRRVKFEGVLTRTETDYVRFFCWAEPWQITKDCIGNFSDGCKPDRLGNTPFNSWWTADEFKRLYTGIPRKGRMKEVSIYLDVYGAE